MLLGSIGVVSRFLMHEAKNKVIARTMNVILNIRFILF